MAHGTPDWWGSAPKGTTHTLADMAELAVRLGSIVTFDRRGDVIFIENFNGGLAGWGYGGTGLMTVDLVCFPCASGSLAVDLVAPVGVDEEGWLRKVLPYPVLSKIGMESWFNPQFYLRHFFIQIALFDGAYLLKFTARYNHPAGTIEVEDPANNWNVIGTPGMQRTDADCYSILKLVVDSLSGDYVRVICNNHQYDATGYSGVSSVNTTTPMSMTIVHGVVKSGAYTLSVNIDNVIVTQNEP